MDPSAAGIAERIRRTRITLKLTQKFVAEFCGVTKSAVSQWETKGFTSLKLVTFFKLCEVLRANPRWVALGVGPKKPGTVFVINGNGHNGNG